jgi:surface antigen
MSFTDRRQPGVEQQPGKRLLRPSGLIGQYSPIEPIEQLPFPDAPASGNGLSQEQQYLMPPTPGTIRQFVQSGPITSPGETGSLIDIDTSPELSRALIDPNASPNTTRQLSEIQTGMLPITRNSTTSLRPTVVIPGTGKKSTGLKRPPKGRRMVVHSAVTGLLVLIVLGALLTVLPAGNDAHGVFSLFNPKTSMVNSRNSNSGPQIAAQAATATAVTQDGYDPGAGASYAGVSGPPAGSYAPGNHFYWGQCTYWAAMRYNQLTGLWIPWIGNAAQWSYEAGLYKWVVSSTPKLHSVIVLQPFVQGSGYYGHVAIVEKINPDGSVYTSNWNWSGHWGMETFETFYPGSGVSFVYAAGR